MKLRDILWSLKTSWTPQEVERWIKSKNLTPLQRLRMEILARNYVVELGKGFAFAYFRAKVIAIT